jgi:hypothetical protein
MEFLTMKLWSPYLVGLGIGILSWFTFLLSNQPIGCSTAFARTSGMMERWFIGNRVDEKLYFKEFPAFPENLKYNGFLQFGWLPLVAILLLGY